VRHDSFTLKVTHKLTVFVKRMLRNKVGSKRHEENEPFSILHNADISELFRSPDVVGRVT
jgi:hypothetical protein